MSAANKEPLTLEQEIEAIREEPKYDKLSTHELQQEQKNTLRVLKLLESRLDRELQAQRKSMVSLNPNQKKADQHEVVLENIKNNAQKIKTLEHQLRRAKQRREKIKAQGYESKVSDQKYELERRIGELKQEMKRMEAEERSVLKKLRGTDGKEPLLRREQTRLEEELRACSTRYVKLLEKYNKVTDQVAISSSAQEPELHIPEEIYNKELEEREEAQFKEYQSIVKLCTILSKRNDSDSNKHSRTYNQKLRELERIIINLGQIDRMIALKESEAIEGRKNLELIRHQLSNDERVDESLLFSASQTSYRRNAHSMSRLPLENQEVRERQFSRGSMEAVGRLSRRDGL